MAKVHGIWSSFFGDNEYDIGSMRWGQYLTSTNYVMDVSAGKSRAFVVAWEETFPLMKSSFADYSFFDDPARWREDSFTRAREAWDYLTTDYVIFMDCSEGLTFNDTVATTGDPLLGWLQDEATADTVYFPYYAFMRGEPPVQYQRRIISQEVENDALAAVSAVDQDTTLTYDERVAALETPRLILGANRSVHNHTYPMYHDPSRWIPRMFRVSELLDPSFDWSSLDTPVTTGSAPDKASKTSIVSYGYARWAVADSDINPDTQIPYTTPASAYPHPSAGGPDVGWEMRTQLNAVRPIPGLNDTDWSDITNETAASVGYCPAGITPSSSPTSGTVTLTDLRTPIYGAGFRDNIRDGLYYEDEELGPVPWNQLLSKTAVDEDTWSDQ